MVGKNGSTKGLEASERRVLAQVKEGRWRRRKSGSTVATEVDKMEEQLRHPAHDEEGDGQREMPGEEEHDDEQGQQTDQGIEPVDGKTAPRSSTDNELHKGTDKEEANGGVEHLRL